MSERLEPVRVKHPTNVRLGGKNLLMDKHYSLFFASISDEEKG
jgi:hypothetical protein